MRRTSLLLTATLIATPVLAEDVYRWTDANGEVHYTNDPSSIPPGRKAAKVTNQDVTQERREPGRGAAPQHEAPAHGTAPEPAAGEEAGEAHWRALFRGAHERIARLEAEVQADKATLADPAGHGIHVVYNYSAGGAVTPSPELEKVKEHLARTEQELEQARRDLDELERQASREAVPREWRR